jgi:8-oxo-dGTP diphosphatase
LQVFGVRKPERDIVLRTGVYGIVTDSENRVLIVKNRLGYFLPGGGVNENETYESALRREFLEETGYSIEIKKELETVAWYIDTPIEYFLQVYNTGVFYEIELKEKITDVLEADHEIMFIDGERATDMHSDAQAWLIYKYVMSKKYKPFIYTNDDKSHERVYPLRIAARCIIKTYDEKIVLVKSDKLNICGIPGGGVLRGEDVRDAAIRECLEETGIEIDKLKELGSSVEYSSMLQLTYYFYADAKNAGNKTRLTQLECDWDIYPVFADVNEAKKLICGCGGTLMHEEFEVASMSRSRNLAALSAYEKMRKTTT